MQQTERTEIRDRETGKSEKKGQSAREKCFTPQVFSNWKRGAGTKEQGNRRERNDTARARHGGGAERSLRTPKKGRKLLSCSQLS